MKYVYAILIAATLLGFYIWLRKLNSETPIPEGCENLTPDCEACGIKDCATRPVMMKKKEGEETK